MNKRLPAKAKGVVEFTPNPGKGIPDDRKESVTNVTPLPSQALAEADGFLALLTLMTIAKELLIPANAAHNVTHPDQIADRYWTIVKGLTGLTQHQCCRVLARQETWGGKLGETGARN